MVLQIFYPYKNGWDRGLHSPLSDYLPTIDIPLRRIYYYVVNSKIPEA